ncbi:MAG: bifunctional 5,10-methylenetetrahydrofolate dehydrogenase/5,10-methenyltetrahydrofolate cyclohydrolase [Patescibacteria group bacterium]|nr:bifunctional 5,10-methylenetetrahydrofolate dehydrogenase/5,10-methenyltetrahydrofolate cyclohydrolase [Patescibacteria group bacterium]
MPAQLIDGKSIAERIEAETRAAVANMARPPLLAALLVGDDPASRLYVRLKEKACRRVGVNFRLVELPPQTEPADVRNAIRELNDDPEVTAFIVQLPLPEPLRPLTDELLKEMKPSKDADGFHPDNLAALEAGEARVLPVLAAVVAEIIKTTGRNISEKKAVVVGNSDVFFRPVAHLLRAGGANTSFTNADVPNLIALCREADILIVAVGRPRLIKEEMIKPGAIVIDIGTNKVDGRVVGDVDFDAAKDIAGWLTPVPGGVGPMTVAVLIRNAVELARPLETK